MPDVAVLHHLRYDKRIRIKGMRTIVDEGRYECIVRPEKVPVC